MLTSLPYQYLQSQKRPLVVENTLYKNKRKKRQHDTTIFPSMTVNQSSPLISIDNYNQDIINTFTKNGKYKYILSYLVIIYMYIRLFTIYYYINIFRYRYTND